MGKEQYFPQSTNVLIDDIRGVVVARKYGEQYVWFDARKDNCLKGVRQYVNSRLHPLVGLRQAYGAAGLDSLYQCYRNYGEV
jgi:hypothetical protein